MIRLIKNFIRTYITKYGEVLEDTRNWTPGHRQLTQEELERNYWAR